MSCSSHYETPEEKQRIYDAIKVMEHYKENFIFVRVGDPSIGQIKSLIRKEVLKYDIKNKIFSPFPVTTHLFFFMSYFSGNAIVHA